MYIDKSRLKEQRPFFINEGGRYYGFKLVMPLRESGYYPTIDKALLALLNEVSKDETIYTNIF